MVVINSAKTDLFTKSDFKHLASISQFVPRHVIESRQQHCRKPNRVTCINETRTESRQDCCGINAKNKQSTVITLTILDRLQTSQLLKTQILTVSGRFKLQYRRCLFKLIY